MVSGFLKVNLLKLLFGEKIIWLEKEWNNFYQIYKLPVMWRYMKF